MRSLSVGFAFLAIVVSGCAAISGLGDYQEQGSGESQLEQSRQDSGALGDAVPSDRVGDEVAASDPDADPADASAVAPGTSSDDDAGDAAPIVDAGAADVDFDAPPSCGPANCGGCCQNGMCVGGRSVSTCGTGGKACKDCTNLGGACSAGACATAVPDAAPPKTCNASSCGGCIPFYQRGCCKSDQTCGCEVAISTDCK